MHALCNIFPLMTEDPVLVFAYFCQQCLSVFYAILLVCTSNVVFYATWLVYASNAVF